MCKHLKNNNCIIFHTSLTLAYVQTQNIKGLVQKNTIRDAFIVFYSEPSVSVSVYSVSMKKKHIKQSKHIVN